MIVVVRKVVLVMLVVMTEKVNVCGDYDTGNKDGDTGDSGDTGTSDTDNSGAYVIA